MITADTKQVQNRSSQSSSMLESWQLGLRPHAHDVRFGASYRRQHDDVVANPIY